MIQIAYQVKNGHLLSFIKNKFLFYHLANCIIHAISLSVEYQVLIINNVDMKTEMHFCLLKSAPAAIAAA